MNNFDRQVSFDALQILPASHYSLGISVTLAAFSFLSSVCTSLFP